MSGHASKDTTPLVKLAVGKMKDTGHLEKWAVMQV